MQLVAVDIGNSSAKIAIEHFGSEDRTRNNDRWCFETIFQSADNFQLDPQVVDPGQTCFWAVSSVNDRLEQDLSDWVDQHRAGDQFHLIQPHEINLESVVDSRLQLGRDRLIASWQAVELNSGGPVIVIDAGTAVTIDLVDERNVFQGGLILPGATANLQTLANQTDALPDLTSQKLARFNTQQSLPFVGRSTESAILLGVYQTQIAVMNTAVRELSASLAAPPAIILTGRGIQEVLPWLPESWQFIPDLVLQGARNVGRQLLKQTHRPS
jgi:type III pantothenate kinase